MLKKLLVAVSMCLSTLSVSWAAVDVNTADPSALETLSGVGPKRSKAIVDERTRNGPYKDAADFMARVPGIGEKSLAKLQNEGLTFGKGGAAPAPARKDARDARKK